MATRSPELAETPSDSLQTKGSRFQKYLYFNYRLFFAIKVWLRQNLTRTGTFLIVCAIAAGATGIDTDQALAYQAFSFLACLLALAFMMRKTARSEFTARRVLPRFGTAGSPLKYKIYLSSNSRKAIEGVHLLEIFSDPRPSFQDFLLLEEPGERRRNWFDRRYKYYRWLWILRMNQIADASRIECPFLNIDEEAEVSVEIHPRRRGILNFDTLAILCPDPTGLFNSVIKIPLPDNIVILPKRYSISDFALPGTLKYQHGGVALASAIGESEEFVALREYRPGDSTRRIHWKSWAKTGTPIVKEYQDEFFTRHALILDTFANGIEDEVFEEAVSVAASFACSVQTQESLLDLLFVGPEAYCFTTGRSLGQSEQMLEILASVKMCADRPFLSLHHHVMSHVSDVSGCICVFLTWNSDRAELIKLLETLQLPVTALVICRPSEAERFKASDESIPACVRFIETGRLDEQLTSL